MGSNGRKRSRSITDENRAECPFSVTQPVPSRSDRDRQKGGGKRQKRDDGEEEKKLLHQSSPFTPRGRFKTCTSLDCLYNVDPRKRWFEMTRYNSFVLNNHKYYNEGYVFVANEMTIERQKGESRDGQSVAVGEWVAKILEIRAADEHHVYARVFWMYGPDELPPNTIDGKKSVSGRQPYHGKNELIASNHMDIINVVSITMPATVNQWIETDDEDIQSALYWRQAYDCRTGELSAVHPTCRCNRPANPDVMLIGCTNGKCSKWLHPQCLTDDILTKLYAKLGTDKPHVSAKTGAKHEVKDEDGASDAMSSSDVKNEDSVMSIDVLGGQTATNIPVKEVDGQPEGSDGTPNPSRLSSVSEQTPKPSSEKKPRKKGGASRPGQGLFEATIKMNDGPTHWIIEDKRANVKGGDRTWTEKVACLVCGSIVD